MSRYKNRGSVRTQGMISNPIALTTPTTGYVGEEEDIRSLGDVLKKMHTGWHSDGDASDVEALDALAEGDVVPSEGIVIGNVGGGFGRFRSALNQFRGDQSYRVLADEADYIADDESLDAIEAGIIEDGNPILLGNIRYSGQSFSGEPYMGGSEGIEDGNPILLGRVGRRRIRRRPVRGFGRFGRRGRRTAVVTSPMMLTAPQLMYDPEDPYDAYEDYEDYEDGADGIEDGNPILLGNIYR